MSEAVKVRSADPTNKSGRESILSGSGRSAVLLQDAHEVLLLLVGLESTVTELGSGIDQRQPDLFGGDSLRLRDERLTNVENSLPDADARAFKHDKVLLHHTVVREATHGIDGLLRDVLIRHSVVAHELSVFHVVSGSDAVNLLVNLRSVMVTLLTNASDRIGHSRRMPSSDTGHFTKTFVCFTRQLLYVPTGNDTFDTVTLGDADDVDHFVLGEDVLDGDGLFHQSAGEVDLLGDRAAVQLDLVNVGLLLTLTKKFDLRVRDDADNGAVFLHLGEVFLDLFLAIFGGPLLGIFGEGLLLGRVPVLVEASSDFLGEMLCPDGLEGPHAVRSFDVSDDADDHDGRCLDDGDGLDDFLLVGLGTGTVHHTADMGHTRLVPGEGGEMDRLLGVILGEALDSSLMVLAALLGQKAQIAVTRRGKFTVRHRSLTTLYISKNFKQIETTQL